MSDRGFSHQDADKKADEKLRDEARAHLAKSSAAQLAAELLIKLREVAPPWWRPQALRETWTATDRMRWLEQRPELRQQITTRLTGLAPKAARSKSPDFQASLIDAVIDEGDIDIAKFETAFEPGDLAVYGVAASFWQAFRARMPWHEESQAHIDLVAWLLRVLMADRSSIDGCTRTPIVTAWDVRSSIDGRIWHTRMPLDVRVAIDDARLKQEKGTPSKPFMAAQDLSIAVPELIAANIPLKDLEGVLGAAERALGFDRSPPAAPARAVSSPPSVGAARADAPTATSPAGEAPARGDAPTREVPARELPIRELPTREVPARGGDGAAARDASVARSEAPPPRAGAAARDAAPARAESPSSPPVVPPSIPPSIPPSVAPPSARATSPGLGARPLDSSAAVTRPRASSPPGAAAAPFIARPGPSDPPRPRAEPSVRTRPAMNLASLMEDDDLEPTNPSLIPDEDESYMMDNETTNRDGTSSSGKRPRRR